jgi:hypothetical protein
VTAARLSTRWAQLLAALAVLWIAAAVDAGSRRAATTRRAQAQEALVRRLDLTDPCLFTDARYTRHLSQADRFSAFQDHPRALEHLPSGALVARPPQAARR